MIKETVIPFAQVLEQNLGINTIWGKRAVIINHKVMIII